MIYAADNPVIPWVHSAGAARQAVEELGLATEADTLEVLTYKLQEMLPEEQL